MSTPATDSGTDLHPTGIEGATDTNCIPWLAFEPVPGLSFKPLRVSHENGFFSAILKFDAGLDLPQTIFLGGIDLLVLSGGLDYDDGAATSALGPGTWGYVSSGSTIASIRAGEETEILANLYGPVAFLDADRHVRALLTGRDLLAAARARGVAVVPNTLAECMREKPEPGAQKAEPLKIAGIEASRLVVSADAPGTDGPGYAHPHFVDTRRVPWIVNDAQPDIALKVLRVSEETGITSLIVRHNGVAGPHAHLGAGDFLILHGQLGYRAGPPEGYGAGVWVFEPAGARHEATQRVGDDDLIYTANLYGPIAFDSGPGTPPVAILSWMEYKALAEAAGATLVRAPDPDDKTLLAWAPLATAAS